MTMTTLNRMYQEKAYIQNYSKKSSLSCQPAKTFCPILFPLHLSKGEKKKGCVYAVCLITLFHFELFFFSPFFDMPHFRPARYPGMEQRGLQAEPRPGGKFKQAGTGARQLAPLHRPVCQSYIQNHILTTLSTHSKYPQYCAIKTIKYGVKKAIPVIILVPI